jgi:hypothetical protein
VLERLSPNLSHGNPGIVLSTIRIIVKFMDFMTNTDVIRSYCSKVTQTLITLIGNSDHEFKYVVLKNINVIVQKRPLILNREIRIFFCSHNDPHYVKIEKLEILLKLADEENIDPILVEIKEYVTEVDIEFVRKCIRTLGRLAIKLENSANICVDALFECLKNKVNYVIQESIIVLRDIFRKYPTKYESILNEMFKNQAAIDEPEAKSAFIWIIGEYAQSIPQPSKLLEVHLASFKEETTDVQIQIMTSCIKLLLVRPQEGSPLVKALFQIIEECDNPDLRDRGYFYWRLLAKSTDVAKKVVYSQKPPINDLSFNFESSLLDKLVDGISSLSAVYHKAPEAFVKILRDSKNQRWEEQEEDKDEPTANSTGEDRSKYRHREEEMDDRKADEGTIDLLGGSDEPPAKPVQARKPEPTPVQTNPFVEGDDLLSDSGPKPSKETAKNIKIPMALAMAETVPGKEGVTGVRVLVAVQREGNSIFLELEVENKTNSGLGTQAIRLDANSYKLQPVSINLSGPVTAPGGVQDPGGAGLRRKVERPASRDALQNQGHDRHQPGHVRLPDSRELQRPADRLEQGHRSLLQ